MKNRKLTRFLKLFLLGSVMMLALSMMGCSSKDTKDPDETDKQKVEQSEQQDEQENITEYVFVSEGNSAERLNPQSGGADEESKKLREAIMNTKDELEIGEGTVYYISSINGDNTNAGTSPEAAWETLSAYSKIRKDLEPGDCVLFERGGVYRGNIILASGVTYGAYGNGPKPAIYGSDENYSGKNYMDENYWIKTDKENVWLCSEYVSDDIGTIVFDHGRAVGKRIFTKMDNLVENFEFYHNTDTAQVYLYLEQDPSEAFYDIEFCVKGDILQGPADTTDVTIDNLSIKYGGSHGIAFKDGESNITITNCELGWIGGSLQNSTVRYGNAIEFWNECSNLLVENNWIYQIYDAGLTHQGNDVGGYEQSNITYRGNLVEYCSYGIEYFTGNPAKDFWKDITIEENIVRFSGYGWGVVRPDPANVAIVNGWGHTAGFKAQNFVIKNNIFDVSANWLIQHFHVTKMPVEFVGNTYYQKAGKVAYWTNKTELETTNQESLEKAISVIDSAPKLVQFLK